MDNDGGGDDDNDDEQALEVVFHWLSYTTLTSFSSSST